MNNIMPPNSSSVDLQMRIPVNLFKGVQPHKFESTDVPLPIWDFAQQVSNSTGFDISGLVVSAVTAIASVIDDRLELTVRPGWKKSARQWSVLLGTSATGKSPIIQFATDPIKDMHSEMVAVWCSKNTNLEPEKREPVPALYTSDTTVAALSEKLRGNERGLIILTEEISSWIGGIESSNKGESSKNRGAMLQLRDGGKQQIDRIIRGTFIVKNWGASLLAASTPDGLASQFKHLPEDGLIQRITPCIIGLPDVDAPENNLDPTMAIRRWEEILRWVFDVTGKVHMYMSLSFDSNAQKEFSAEEKAIRQLVPLVEDFAPAYASHLGKHPGMLAEICIIFHILSSNSNGIDSLISRDTVRTAIRYMRRIREHSQYLYSTILSTSPAIALATHLARSIVASEAVLDTIGGNWMTQHCQAFKIADGRVRSEAVQILVYADWIEVKAGCRTYRGQPTEYTVNANVYKLFSEQGELWRERRKIVRDIIKSRTD